MKKYKIPKNIQANLEIFKGIGLMELLIILVGIVIGIVIALILYLIFRSYYVVLAIPFFGLIGVLLCQKDPRTNLNMINTLLTMHRFNTQRKLYYSNTHKRK